MGSYLSTPTREQEEATQVLNEQVQKAWQVSEMLVAKLHIPFLGRGFEYDEKNEDVTIVRERLDILWELVKRDRMTLMNSLPKYDAFFRCTDNSIGTVQVNDLENPSLNNFVRLYGKSPLPGTSSWAEEQLEWLSAVRQARASDVMEFAERKKYAWQAEKDEWREYNRAIK